MSKTSTVTTRRALSGGPPQVRKPDSLLAAFPSFRWRLYYSFLMKNANHEQRAPLLHGALSDYACRQWNRSHTGGRALTRVTLEYWIERTDRPVPIERVVYHEQDCPG